MNEMSVAPWGIWCYWS